MLPAITIRWPWSAAITLGRKPIENRSQNVLLRGEIAIHSGKSIDEAALRDSRIIGALGDNPVPVLGAIVAVAQLVDCHQAQQPLDPTVTCCGEWADRLTAKGRPAWHLVLDNVRALPQPVPCRGQLFIGWPVPEEIEAKVREQLVKEATR